MKNLRCLLVALLVSVSTTVSAVGFNTENEALPTTKEIEKMLMDSELVIEEGFTVNLVFKLTEDRRIEIRSIQADNEEVKAFLYKRLQGKKLQNKNWISDKIYQLPVRVQAKR